jgi:hypothetical protein
VAEVVAINNPQVWKRGQSARKHRGRRRASTTVRLHWLRIGVLGGVVAFWTGVALIVFQVI